MKNMQQIINKRLEEMREGSKQRAKTYELIGAKDLRLKELERIEIIEDIIYKASYMEILDLTHYINDKQLTIIQYEKNEERAFEKMFIYEMIGITISNIILTYNW